MSYILDALRRAESERERGQVPGLHAQPVPGLGDSIGERRSAGLRLGAVAAAVLVVLGAAAWWWLRPGSDMPAPGAGAATEGGLAAGPAATSTTSATASPATSPTTSATALPAAPPANPSATRPVASPPGPPMLVAPPAPPEPPAPPPARPRPPATETVAARNEPRTAAVRPPPVVPPATPATPSTSPAASPPAPPVAAAPPAMAGTAAPPAPGAAGATSAKPTLLADLPPAQRAELPQMLVGGSIYSDQPSSRFVVINGLVVREGETAAPGVVLERIAPKAAVIRWREMRIEVPL